MPKSSQLSYKNYTIRFLQKTTSKTRMYRIRTIKNIFSYCLYIHNLPS